MAEIVYAGYEISSQNSGHWPVPYARMTDTTPTPTNPARVTATLAQAQVCGTVMSIDANTSIAVVDFSPGMVYMHSVRNVTTYGGAVETVWAAINVGDVVYYDASATMPAGVKLSLSPLDNTGAATPTRFGVVAYSARVTFPLASVAATTVRCPVMQRGAGA